MYETSLVDKLIKVGVDNEDLIVPLIKNAIGGTYIEGSTPCTLFYSQVFLYCSRNQLQSQINAFETDANQLSRYFHYKQGVRHDICCTSRCCSNIEILNYTLEMTDHLRSLLNPETPPIP